MSQIELRVPEEPVCPAARAFSGAIPADGGVVCGIKERDGQLADPILEGSPTGVVLRWREDASTLLNFCCGQGEPLADPDEMAHREFGRGHYTGCPIWAAAVEWDLVERLFRMERPDAEVRDPRYVPDEDEVRMVPYGEAP